MKPGIRHRAMRRKLGTLGTLTLAAGALLLAGAIDGASSPAAGADALAHPIDAFASPVYVAVAPGQPRLLFVVERAGRIQVLRDERTLTQPFLDIRDIVFGPPDLGAGGEQGLFSVAFPPGYAQSGRFYVAFTNANWDIEIDEFRRSAANPALANRTTRRRLLIIPHRGAQNHNGGQLQFGPDGLLYISTGDGGNLTPRGEPARNLESLLGKILRISPMPTNTRPYGIPNTNPFVGQAGRDEIYSYGLRNPWRFSFDGNVIAIGDVGQARREEINLLSNSAAARANFGWPQYEGRLVFDNTRPGAHPPKFPIFDYAHSGGRCSVVGGYVVRNPGLPGLNGRYLYGDTCTGELRSFVANPSTQRVSGDRPAGITLPGLSSFGRGFNGRIYTAQIGGRVSRLVPVPDGAAGQD